MKELKRKEVYLELVDSETCKEIARILEESGEEVYYNSMNFLKKGRKDEYTYISYYNNNYWCLNTCSDNKTKITIEELKQLVGFKEMDTFKIGDRVKVINGGSGAFCANDTIGTIISRGEVDFDNYNGEYRGTIAPVYVKCDGGKYYGLCDGYKLEHIKTEPSMKNQYIKCLSPEHGKRIIAYFESKGFKNSERLTGCSVDCYYGADEERITCESTLPEDGIEIFLPEETYTITRKALSEVYPLIYGCSKWRKTVEAILNTNLFTEEFTVSKERVLEAYSEANPKQLEWLNKYLPKPKKKVTKDLIRVGVVMLNGIFHTTCDDLAAAKAAYPDCQHVELRGTYEVFE